MQSSQRFGELVLVDVRDGRYLELVAVLRVSLLECLGFLCSGGSERGDNEGNSALREDEEGTGETHALTRYPFARTALMICEPRNPEAPVT
jgi:hypothetical protein